MDCFFKKKPKVTEGDIKHLQNLRYEDQERLCQRINKTGSKAKATNAKKVPQKRTYEAIIPKPPSYSLEYSKSAISKCSSCKTKIPRGKVRIKEDVVDLVNGTEGEYYHVVCFPPEKLRFFPNGGQSFAGYKLLTLVDQKVVQQMLPKTKTEDVVDTKILRLDTPSTSLAVLSNSKEQTTTSSLKEQNIRFYQFKDEVKKQLKKKQQIELLEANGQSAVYGNKDHLANQVADLLTFGALDKCTQCREGQFYYMNSGFLCTGSISEWTKCKNLDKSPSRTVCIIPDSLSEYEFLNKVKSQPEDRLFRYVAPSKTTLREHAKYEEKQLERFQAMSGKSMDRSDKSVKMTIKGGSAVDPDSGLNSIAKVYVCGNDKYSVVLGLTDLQRNRNSFYKIQLLVTEDGKRCWVFRSWGRIGM